MSEVDAADVVAAEDAELAELRAGLIADARDIAVAQARQVRREARAFQIARARMRRQGTESRAREMELRSIALELGAALRVPDRTMQNRLGVSGVLVERFAATVDALEGGRISRRHVDVIRDAGTALDDPAARGAYETAVLGFAAESTAAGTKAFALRVAEQVHPRPLSERHAAARERRFVSVVEVDDGMAELHALLPAAVAFGVHDRLTRMAKELRAQDEKARQKHAAAKGAGLAGESSVFDDRTRDQLRADLLTDLLLTGAPAVDGMPAGIGAIRAHVQVTIPATTLTGTTAGGGELNGRAAVDRDSARRFAGDAPGWDRVFTHPVTGTVVEVDRYEPLAAQRRFLRARDVHCRAPGCRQPARENQLDHTHERQHGGRTHLSNLASLCIRHHTLKTETAWTVTQLPGGTLVWSSPLGHRYRDDPPRRVTFAPRDDDDATARPAAATPATADAHLGPTPEPEPETETETETASEDAHAPF